MRIIRYPSREEWSNIVKRPQLDVSQLNAIVDEVLTDIRRNGDSAVKAYETKFDHVELQSLAVTDEEIRAAEGMISKELYDALVLAHQNISTFHETQRFEGSKIQTQPGVTCWQKSVPIEKVVELMNIAKRNQYKVILATSPE